MLQTLISRSAIAAILLTAPCAVAFGAEDRTISIDDESTVSAKPDMANGNSHGELRAQRRLRLASWSIDPMQALGSKSVLKHLISLAIWVLIFGLPPGYSHAPPL